MEARVAMKFAKVMSVLVASAVVVGVLLNLNDIRRYIRISTM
jgi:hypothetical protein